MSGGSWNYASYDISDAASRMAIWDKELSELLEDLSHVCHDCEWADDSDISEEDARDAIKRFKAKWFGTDRAERLPQTQCPYYHGDRHYCSVHEDVRAIDRDALLALADEMNDACPESASVAIGYIDDYALRIREACGVAR